MIGYGNNHEGFRSLQTPARGRSVFGTNTTQESLTSLMNMQQGTPMHAEGRLINQQHFDQYHPPASPMTPAPTFSMTNGTIRRQDAIGGLTPGYEYLDQGATSAITQNAQMRIPQTMQRQQFTPALQTPQRSLAPTWTPFTNPPPPWSEIRQQQQARLSGLNGGQTDDIGRNLRQVMQTVPEEQELSMISGNGLNASMHSIAPQNGNEQWPVYQSQNQPPPSSWDISMSADQYTQSSRPIETSRKVPIGMPPSGLQTPDSFGKGKGKGKGKGMHPAEVWNLRHGKGHVDFNGNPVSKGGKGGKGSGSFEELMGGYHGTGTPTRHFIQSCIDQRMTEMADKMEMKATEGNTFGQPTNRAINFDDEGEIDDFFGGCAGEKVSKDKPSAEQTKAFLRKENLQEEETKRQDEQKEIEMKFQQYHQEVREYNTRKAEIEMSRSTLLTKAKDENKHLSEEELNKIAPFPTEPTPPVDLKQGTSLQAKDYFPTSVFNAWSDAPSCLHDPAHVPYPRVMNTWQSDAQRYADYHQPPSNAEIQDLPVWAPPSLDAHSNDSKNYRERYIAEARVAKLYNSGMTMMDSVASLAANIANSTMWNGMQNQQQHPSQNWGSQSGAAKQAGKTKPWYKDLKMTAFPKIKPTNSPHPIARAQNLMVHSIAAEEWFAGVVGNGRIVHRNLEGMAHVMYKTWLEAPARQKKQLSYGWKSEPIDDEETRAYEQVYQHMLGSCTDAVGKLTRDLVQREPNFYDCPLWRISILLFALQREYGFKSALEVQSCLNFCKNPRISYHNTNVTPEEQLTIWKRLTSAVSKIGMEGEESILRTAVPLLAAEFINFHKTGDPIKLANAIGVWQDNQLENFNISSDMLYNAFEELESLFSDNVGTENFGVTSAGGLLCGDIASLPQSRGSFGGANRQQQQFQQPTGGIVTGAKRFACLKELAKIPHDKNACGFIHRGDSGGKDAQMPPQWRRKLQMLVQQAGVAMPNISNFYSEEDPSNPIHAQVYLGDFDDAGLSFKARMRNAGGGQPSQREIPQKDASTPLCNFWQNDSCIYAEKFCRCVHKCAECGSDSHGIASCPNLSPEARKTKIDELNKKVTANMTGLEIFNTEDTQQFEEIQDASGESQEPSPGVVAADIPVPEPSWNDLSLSFATVQDIDGWDDDQLEAYCDNLHDNAPDMKLGPDGTAVYQAAELRAPPPMKSETKTCNMFLTDQGANGCLVSARDCRILHIGNQSTVVETTNGATTLLRGLVKIPLVNSHNGVKPSEETLADARNWVVCPCAVSQLEVNIVPLYFFGCLGKSVGWVDHRFSIRDAFDVELDIVERNRLFYLHNGAVFCSNVPPNAKGKYIFPWHKDFKHEDYEIKANSALVVKARWESVLKTLQVEKANLSEFREVFGTMTGCFMTNHLGKSSFDAPKLSGEKLLSMKHKRISYGKHEGSTFAHIYSHHPGYIKWTLERYPPKKEYKYNSKDPFHVFGEWALQIKEREIEVQSEPSEVSDTEMSTLPKLPQSPLKDATDADIDRIVGKVVERMSTLNFDAEEELVDKLAHELVSKLADGKGKTPGRKVRRK